MNEYKPFQPTLLTRVEQFHSNKYSQMNIKEQELADKKADVEALKSQYEDLEQQYLETFDSKIEPKLDELREKIKLAEKVVQKVVEQKASLKKSQFKLNDEDVPALREEYLTYIKDTEPMFVELTKLKDEFKKALLAMVDRHWENQASSSYVLSYIGQHCNWGMENAEFRKVRSALSPFAQSEHAEFHSFPGEIQEAYSQVQQKLGANNYF